MSSKRKAHMRDSVEFIPIPIKIEFPDSPQKNLYPKFEINACLLCESIPHTTVGLVEHMQAYHGITAGVDFQAGTVCYCLHCPESEECGNEINGMSIFLAHVNACKPPTKKTRRKKKVVEDDGTPKPIKSRKRPRKLESFKISTSPDTPESPRSSKRLEEKRLKTVNSISTSVEVGTFQISPAVSDQTVSIPSKAEVFSPIPSKVEVFSPIQSEQMSVPIPAPLLKIPSPIPTLAPIVKRPAPIPEQPPAAQGKSSTPSQAPVAFTISAPVRPPATQSIKNSTPVRSAPVPRFAPVLAPASPQVTISTPVQSGPVRVSTPVRRPAPVSTIVKPTAPSRPPVVKPPSPTLALPLAAQVKTSTPVPISAPVRAPVAFTVSAPVRPPTVSVPAPVIKSNITKKDRRLPIACNETNNLSNPAQVLATKSGPVKKKQDLSDDINVTFYLNPVQALVRPPVAQAPLGNLNTTKKKRESLISDNLNKTFDAPAPADQSADMNNEWSSFYASSMNITLDKNVFVHTGDNNKTFLIPKKNSKKEEKALRKLVGLTKWTKVPNPKTGMWNCKKCNAQFGVQKFYMLHVCGRFPSPDSNKDSTLPPVSKRQKLQAPITQRNLSIRQSWK